jgi:hypothetical protein
LSEDKRLSYIRTFFGGVGTILVALGAARFINISDSKGFYLVLFGFLLSVGYINYLEKKAGVSNKVTWIRALLSAIVLLILFYFLYW